MCSPGGICDFYSMPPATFNTLLDWLQPRAANGTIVKTVGEVMGGSGPPATPTLTVSKSGAGSGTVTSSPAGINCGSTCTASYDNGTSVTLSAAAASGSTFAGWSGGGCSGTGTCTVTLTTNTTVTAAFTAAPSGPYAPGIVADGPAGYWRLGETSGTTAADSAATNTGTYVGATLNAASLLAAETGNKAVTVNGTNQYVRVPSSAGLSPSARVSVEAWIKPTTVPTTGFHGIVAKAESYALQFNAGRLEFTVIQGATRRRLQAPAGAIVAGTTYHIVGTYDGSNQRLYINGVQRATAALTGAINVNANNLTFGSWNGSQEFYGGAIDEVAVYAAALSAAQALAHYNAGNGGAPPAQVQLNVTKGGTGSGTVTSTPSGINCGATCSASFNTGTSVTLTATASSGSTFTGWSGGGCSGTGTCVVSLSSNTAVDAGFAPIPTSTLSVTKSGTGSGTVSSSPSGINCGATCAAAFPTGNSVTLTATASSGSTFTGWSGGGCSGTGTCVVTLNADSTVTAGFGPAPVSSYQQTVVADAPAGYWRLNETSGTSAVKTTGAANNGTYTNVTLGVAGLLAGAGNTAASFSGTNSRVQIASNAAVSPTARISVEAWIKPTALPANNAFNSIVSKAESYSLQFNGPRLEFTIIQGGARRRLQAPVGAIAVGGTYHVVGVYDGANQSLYVNGTQVATVALTGAITANNNALYIGSWNGSSEFFRGTIDEVAVYSTALTETQVANHRTAGTTP